MQANAFTVQFLKQYWFKVLQLETCQIYLNPSFGLEINSLSSSLKSPATTATADDDDAAGLCSKIWVASVEGVKR